MKRSPLFLALFSLAAFAATPAYPDDKGNKDGKGQKDRNGKGDKDEKKEKEKEKDPKDTPEWKNCAAIGREFAAKDAAALVARMGDDKLVLKFGDKVDGSFGPEQAKSVLRDWFKEKGEIALELKSLKGNVGIFQMSVTTGKTRRSPLHVEIRKRASGGFVLVRIEKLPESP